MRTGESESTQRGPEGFYQRISSGKVERATGQSDDVEHFETNTDQQTLPVHRYQMHIQHSVSHAQADSLSISNA